MKTSLFLITAVAVELASGQYYDQHLGLAANQQQEGTRHLRAVQRGLDGHDGHDDGHDAMSMPSGSAGDAGSAKAEKSSAKSAKSSKSAKSET